jgi:hypothetical protein
MSVPTTSSSTSNAPVSADPTSTVSFVICSLWVVFLEPG